MLYISTYLVMQYINFMFVDKQSQNLQIKNQNGRQNIHNPENAMSLLKGPIQYILVVHFTS